MYSVAPSTNNPLAYVPALVDTESPSSIHDLLVSLVHVVDTRDSCTGRHSCRVAQYAHTLATVLGWSAAQCRVLEVGAWIHDIGKIGVPDRILQKPGPLTPAEHTVMQAHVQTGLGILHGVRVLAPALPYVAYHHERFDGGGYPFGLAGTAIPLEGRLLAVADSFDAVTSPRPYRDALSLDAGLAELQRHRGTQFDPALLDVLQTAHDNGLLRLYSDREVSLLTADTLAALLHDDHLPPLL